MDFTIHHHGLGTPEDINTYKRSLDEIGCDSPYYCYELLTSAEGEHQRLNYFTYCSADGQVVAVMPFLLRHILMDGKPTGIFDVSSPWGYNGPFFKDSFSGDKKKFWAQVDDWYAKNKVVSEFLRLNFYGNHKNYSGTAVHTLYNVKGDITDWEKFWGNLKPNTRNQFRKAEKSGLQFEMHYNTIGSDKIEDFYKVYIGTMDRRDAIDSFYHPLDYFVTACAHNPDKCAIGLVYFEGTPISCEFFLMSSDSMNSFLGGTDSNHFKLRPNEFLKINAVKWASELGLRYYMIGGGLSNGKEDKLYRYKKKYFPYDEDIDFYTGRKIILYDDYANLVVQAGHDPKGVVETIEEGFFPRYRQPV